MHEYIKTTEQVIPAAMMVTVFPWLNKLLKSPLMKGLMPSEKDPIGFGKIIGHDTLFEHPILSPAYICLTA